MTLGSDFIVLSVSIPGAGHLTPTRPEEGYGSVRGVVLTWLPCNNVVPTKSQALMLCEGPHSIRPAWQDSWVRCSPCCDQEAHALQALPWHPSTSHSLGSWLCDFPQCCSMQPAALGYSTSQKCDTHQKQHTQDAYLQLHCIWPKHWQQLYCKGSFQVTYVSTKTHRLQHSFRECPSTPQVPALLTI